LHSVQEETGISVKAFSDLTQEELSALCRLSPEEAALAKKREYDEPFIVEGGKDEIALIKRKIEEKGMNCVLGGRFLHIFGENDKGKAVEILKELYGFQFFSILTVGIGDSLNDFPMLLQVDHPILLRKKKEPSPSVQNLITINGTGPCAWNEALLSLITKLDI
jgi:predicted mannosyl-3-phosphoglycerate phosphatase (HAD superfamily)